MDMQNGKRHAKMDIDMQNYMNLQHIHGLAA
jgi:hypothetical protein